MLVQIGTSLTCLFRKEENSMITLDVNNFIIDLEEIYPAGKYIVKSVYPVYAYENNKKTDNICAYKYRLVDTSLYETFDVKVDGKSPIVTSEVLRNSEPIWVSLEGAIIKPYEVNYGRAKCSAIANSIHILKE